MKIPSSQNRLPHSFYDRDPVHVARELLGMSLLRKTRGKWIGGQIVETEAYLASGDAASHSARGKTAGNASMFGPPGTLYVYPIHAKYCLNAVTQSSGMGSAVLIRAIEPIWGLPTMQRQRGTDDLSRLTRGPAMLCQALGVDRSLDLSDLVHSSNVGIFQSGQTASRVCRTARIGVTKAQKRKLRFFIDGNWYVSGRRQDHQTRPTRPIKIAIS
ncbi:MAG: DNA-3-methyladenine glycosylase [Rubripirellula sp.]|nr:3-methyladenine DNA glycosylase [Rhodopirellula sp.]MCP4941775.1 DNA-3-methyladenine glycosylase [Planctomycetaceae bacterium]|tara:strand:+ start:1979 stop:2623 length:645 start_codon:yes stop_codon:yes gene_type:complete